MPDYENLWKFRSACLDNDIEQMEAICEEDPSFIKRENPSDLDFTFLAKLYQIQIASNQGELEKVKVLVEKTPELVNFPWSAEEWTPLHQATTKKALPVFRYLLEQGADPTLCSKAEDVSGYSILHATAWEGNVEAARILINLGTDVNQRQSDGTTPLNVAQRRKNVEFADFLISQGANKK